MLQGRALELDNICQEISIKDLCNRPQAHPLSEEKEFDLLARDNDLTVSPALSQLVTGWLHALHQTSLGASGDAAQRSLEELGLQCPPVLLLQCTGY